MRPQSLFVLPVPLVGQGMLFFWTPLGEQRMLSAAMGLRPHAFLYILSGVIFRLLQKTLPLLATCVDFCGIQLIHGSRMHIGISALVAQDMNIRKQSQQFFGLLVP